MKPPVPMLLQIERRRLDRRLDDADVGQAREDGADVALQGGDEIGLDYDGEEARKVRDLEPHGAPDAALFREALEEVAATRGPHDRDGRD